VETKWLNGNLKAIKFYNEEGCLDGVTLRYFKNGNLKDSTTYVSGYVYGRSCSYYKNGNLRSHGFLDGTNSLTFIRFRMRPSPSGVWVEYGRFGRVETESHYPKYKGMAEYPLSKPNCK
jgi:antitoxin component YwqK of YwqJK toxin-antitoxin module